MRSAWGPYPGSARPLRGFNATWIGGHLILEVTCASDAAELAPWGRAGGARHRSTLITPTIAETTRERRGHQCLQSARTGPAPRPDDRTRLCRSRSASTPFCPAGRGPHALPVASEEVRVCDLYSAELFACGTGSSKARGEPSHLDRSGFQLPCHRARLVAPILSARLEAWAGRAARMTNWTPLLASRWRSPAPTCRFQ